MTAGKHCCMEPGRHREEQMDKLTRLFLRGIGVGLILVGLVAAYYGPLEIYVFYFFSDGGRFHYEGFGVGSIWFAYLVVQNLGYYVVAALSLPLGIGYLSARRWALTLTKLYGWFGLGAGIWLFANLVPLLPWALALQLSRAVLLARLGITGVSALLALILFPLLVLWLFRREKVQSLFAARGPDGCWMDTYPFPLLALLPILFIVIGVLHVAIFFQGMFPAFGMLMFGRQSVYLIALCILIVGILIYGLALLKTWAWWGTSIFVSLLAVSTILSFSGLSVYDALLRMDLPAYELELLDGAAFLRFLQPVGLLAVPLLVGLGLLVYSKRYFGTARLAPRGATAGPR
jgi:hypothetical protein